MKEIIEQQHKKNTLRNLVNGVHPPWAMSLGPLKFRDHFYLCSNLLIIEQGSNLQFLPWLFVMLINCI